MTRLLVGPEPWIAVRCVFRHESDSPRRGLRRRPTWLYEERITLWRVDDVAEAFERAEAEAREYAGIVGCEFVGFSESFLAEPPRSGAEVFSLMRASRLRPDRYLDRYFDTGAEPRKPFTSP